MVMATTEPADPSATPKPFGGIEDFAHGIVEDLGAWASRLASARIVAGSPAEQPIPDVPHKLDPLSPDTGYVPDLMTQASLPDVVAALAKAAPELPRSGVLVLTSQYALETGGGRACHRWNLGNAKHIHGDGHKWTAFRCSEIIGGKEVFFDPPHPQTWFRAFDSLEDGAADYLGLLQHRFAVAWPAVKQGNVRAFGHALKVAGYYTASEQAYVNALARWYAILMTN